MFSYEEIMVENQLRKDLTQCKVCKKVYFLSYLQEHLQNCQNDDKVIHEENNSKKKKTLHNHVHEEQKIPEIIPPHVISSEKSLVFCEFINNTETNNVVNDKQIISIPMTNHEVLPNGNNDHTSEDDTIDLDYIAGANNISDSDVVDEIKMEEEDVKKHLNSKNHDDELLPLVFKCDFCSKILPTEYAFKNHVFPIPLCKINDLFAERIRYELSLEKQEGEDEGEYSDNLSDYLDHVLVEKNMVELENDKEQYEKNSDEDGQEEKEEYQLKNDADEKIITDQECEYDTSNDQDYPFKNTFEDKKLREDQECANNTSDDDQDYQFKNTFDGKKIVQETDDQECNKSDNHDQGELGQLENVLDDDENLMEDTNEECKNSNDDDQEYYQFKKTKMLEDNLKNDQHGSTSISRHQEDHQLRNDGDKKMLEEDKDCKIGSTDQDYYLSKNVLDDKEILGDLDDNECENVITNQDFNDDDDKVIIGGTKECKNSLLDRDYQLKTVPDDNNPIQILMKDVVDKINVEGKVCENNIENSIKTIDEINNSKQLKVDEHAPLPSEELDQEGKVMNSIIQNDNDGFSENKSFKSSKINDKKRSNNSRSAFQNNTKCEFCTNFSIPEGFSKDNRIDIEKQLRKHIQKIHGKQALLMHFVNFRGNSSTNTNYGGEILKCDLCDKYSLPLSKLKNRKDGEKFLKKHKEKVHHGKLQAYGNKRNKTSKTRMTIIPEQSHPEYPIIPQKEKRTEEDDEASKYINASCSLCGFKSRNNSTSNHYYYYKTIINQKEILQYHMMQTHFKSEIEDTLPKISPFKCPESGCKNSLFKDFDSLYRHYHIHINLEKFVVFDNKQKSNSLSQEDQQKYKKSCQYCGFKPVSNNFYSYVYDLRKHLVKNHIKEHVESKLPKRDPFVCPKNGCFYNHYTSRFQNYNALYVHYRKHIQLNMFLEMNEHSQNKNETKSSLNLHEKEKYYHAANNNKKGPPKEEETTAKDNKYFDAKCKLCGFKPVSKNIHVYKSILQSHLLRDHFQEKINMLAKNDTRVCPESGCPSAAAAFETFDALFSHYYTHINLDKFVEKSENNGEIVVDNFVEKAKNNGKVREKDLSNYSSTALEYFNVKCALCGFKPVARSKNVYKSMLQSHLLRDHFREKIEKLPKKDPFACPEKGCPKEAKTFDGLFTHYYNHINLEKFVERNNGGGTAAAAVEVRQVTTSSSSKSNNIINWGKIQQLQKSNNLHLAKNDHKKDQKNSSSIKILKTEYDEKYVKTKPILPSCIDVSRVNGQPWKMRGDRKLTTMLKGNK